MARTGTTMSDRDTGQFHDCETMHNRKSEHAITDMCCQMDANPRRQENHM